MDDILVLNAGSSSHKCSLYSGKRLSLAWKGHIQWKENFKDAHLTASIPSSKSIERPIDIHSTGEALQILLNTLWEEPLKVISNRDEIKIVGHRIVFGGEKLMETTRITLDVKKEIEALSNLAPLHNPGNLEGVSVSESNFPDSLQFGVFDTAFHASLPEIAFTYPGPYSWKEKGIRRFGFHGISYQYCAKQAAQFLGKELRSLKMVICHLGAGASLCAIKDGKSIDTTMGLTPLEGLMMASRSGSIDPGIIFYLLKNQPISAEQLEMVLNKESGLLGLSGISEDMRDLMATYDKNKRSKLAVDVFVHRLRSCLGMMLASLEGLDVLVFTAGIGENSPYIRERSTLPFSFLGLKIDPKKNHDPSIEDREISSEKSSVKVLVIPTQEELEIAHECLRASQQLYLP